MISEDITFLPGSGTSVRIIDPGTCPNVNHQSGHFADGFESASIEGCDTLRCIIENPQEKRK
jgi:hypothetical protein